MLRPHCVLCARIGCCNEHFIKLKKTYFFAGEPMSRPHSEFKASTPVDKPPPAPMSAPPELIETAQLGG